MTNGLVLLAGLGIVGAAVYFLTAPRVGEITSLPGNVLNRVFPKQANFGGMFEGGYARDRAIPVADLYYTGANDPRKRVTIA